MMANAIKVLVALAALAFVVAVIASLAGPILRVAAEGYSRACTNLALIAIALLLVSKRERSGS